MTSLSRVITAIFCRLIIAHFYENVNMIDICNMENVIFYWKWSFSGYLFDSALQNCKNRRGILMLQR